MRFLIKLQENQISILEFNATFNRYEALKNKGEEWQEYSNSFWEWFKQKIEYEGEPLEFVLNCDKEIEFDSSLNINSIEYIKDDIPKEIKKKQEEIVKKQTPLAKFFIDKVKEYKER